MPSLAVESPLRRPSPSWLSIFTVAIAVTVAPSIAVAAVDVASWSHFPLPLCCHCAIQHVALPLHHPSLSPCAQQAHTWRTPGATKNNLKLL